MLAVIGGTGIYQLEGVKVLETYPLNDLSNPFGEPSSSIIKAEYNNRSFLFLPRHGENHQLLPHEINYAANLFALKKLGARMVISFSAVGSLRRKIHPGEFVLVSQYFDFIKGHRRKTFFGNGVVAHISTAIPVCPILSRWVHETALEMNLTVHPNKTYGAVDGPRLGTRAESHFLRQIGCDSVGMTNVPEVFLAREAQLCYVSVGIVTDYDCFLDDESQFASVSEVIETYGQSIAKAKSLLLNLLKKTPPQIDETYRQSLKNALLTPIHSISKANQAWLNTLLL